MTTDSNITPAPITNTEVQKSATPFATPANTEDGDSMPIQTPNNDLVYKNLDQGYQLTFPENWRGWYLIDKPDNNFIRVKFYGRSKTGTIAAKEYFGGGLPMFLIMSEVGIEENEPLDSVRKIGTIKAVNYYFATGTGSDVGVLFSIANKESAARQTAKYEVDETELELAAQDWAKVQQMQKDIEGILHTFKAID